MSQKICLVTGANSGIGKEIAILLATTGAHVIMVCRNLEKGQAALDDIKSKSGSNAVDLFIADLSSQESIHALSTQIHARYSMLHVLIHNAGLVLSKKTLSKDQIEMTLATNHLGPFLLTNLLLDLLKKGAPSRIINISSAIHKWGKMDLDDLQYERRSYHFMKAYAQSKLLMNMATFEWARRLDGTGVTVNAVHPGAVKTGLGSDNAHNFLLKCIDKIIKFFFISPQTSAKYIAYLATAPEVASITGQYFVKGRVVPSSAISRDFSLNQQVWEQSERLIIHK